MSIFKDLEKNCSQVIINEQGLSESPAVAEEKHKVIPSIIFWRNDGWSLGAPKEFEKLAYELWKLRWVRYGRSPDFIPETMETYVPVD